MIISLTFFIPNIYENLSGTYIPVSANTAVALFVLNAALLYWILIFKNRLRSSKDKEKEIQNLQLELQELKSKISDNEKNYSESLEKVSNSINNFLEKIN